MKLFVPLFLVVFSVAFGQPPRLDPKTESDPLYLLNGKIVSATQFKNLDPPNVATVSVYKSNNLPAVLEAFSNFALSGIIEVTLKKNTELKDFITLSAVNLQKNIEELNPVYVNDVLIKNPRIKISADAIEEATIIKLEDRDFVSIRTSAENPINQQTTTSADQGNG